MPSKAKKVDREVAKLPSILEELVELFLSGPMTGEAINEAGIAFKKALIEASLNAELSHHLGYASGAEKPEQVSNHRNGSTSKTVLTADGKVLIETPRDRAGSFEPLLLPKHASFYRLRRQHRGAVCAWADGARDPGLSAAKLRQRGQSAVDQYGDRRRVGGGDGVAGPAAGGGLRSRVRRCATGEDPRR